MSEPRPDDPVSGLPPAPGAPRGAGRRGAAVALLVGLLLTALSARWRADAEEAERQEQVDALTEEVLQRFELVVLRYGQVVEDLAAVQALSDSEDAFRSFADVTDLTSLPGLVDAGYVAYATTEEAHALAAEQQRDDPAFALQLAPGDHHAVVAYGAGMDAGVGVDLFALAGQRRTLERAAAAGEPAVGIIEGSDVGLDGGLVLAVYAPVFHDGLPLGTTEERWAALQGWTGLAVSLDEVMAALDLHDAPLLVAVYGPMADGDRLLVEGTPGASAAISRAGVQGRGTLDLGALPLRIHSAYAPGTDASSAVWLVVLCGTLLTVLLAYAVGSELRARRGLEAAAAAEHERALLLQTRFHAAVYQAPVGVAVFDMSGHAEVVNDRLYELLGVERGESSPAVLDYFAPEDLPRVSQHLEDLASGKVDTAEDEFQMRAPNGFRRWVRISASSIRGPDGAPVAVVAHAQDIEKERAAVEELRSRSRWFSSIVERSSDLILLFDADGTVTWASPSIQTILGVSPDEVVGHPIRRFVHRDDFPQIVEATQRTRREGSARVEFRLAPLAGEERWLETTASDLLDDPDVAAIITLSRDVTERHRSTQLLAHQAAHDPLTGLLNRAELEARLDEELERVDRAPLTVAYLDLDGFKAVNDRFGHGTGDALLRAVASVVEGQVRVGDLLARLGGDEFVLVLRETPVPVALEVAERIRAHLQDPVRLPDLPEPIRVTASIGVAAARPGDTVASLLHSADVALYEAKRRGRDRVELSAQVGLEEPHGLLPGAAGGVRDVDLGPGVVEEGVVAPGVDDDLDLLAP